MLKSIVCTYPDFRALPKGLKQMLVTSENLFFSEVHTASVMAESLRDTSRPYWRPPQEQFAMNGFVAFGA